MTRVRLGIGAQRDLVNAVRFYRSSDERIAVRFVAVIDYHMAIIAKHPERAPVAVGTRGTTVYRRLKVTGFPFGILYRLRADVADVVAVADERRRPDYWSRR